MNADRQAAAGDERRGKVVVMALVGAGLLLAVFATWYITANWGK